MSAERSAGLDAFRVVAITCVMCAHGAALGIDAFPWLRYVLILLGVVGVELFFVLSGFLIGRQLLDVGMGTQTIGNFWLRRWFRTLPNYYLFLLANLALYTFVLHKPAGDWSFVIFAHNLFSPFSSAFFGESWSLAVEEWFYLLAPLAVTAAALILPSRHRKFGVLAVVLAIIAASLVSRIWVAHLTSASIDSALRKIILLRLDALAFGVLLAWLERYRPALMVSLANAWSLGALALLAAMAYLALLSQTLTFFAPPEGVHRWLAALLFTLLPMACALILARVHVIQTPTRPWIANQSKWSYSMYLLHFPLLLVLLHYAGGFSHPLTLCAVFFAWYAVTIAGAAIIYRWYEKPLMDLRARFAPKP